MERALQSQLTVGLSPARAWNLSGFQRVLLGVTVLDTSIQVDTYLFYQENWATFGAIGGINISMATICLAALYGLWLMDSAVSLSTYERERMYLNWALTAYVCIAIFSWFVAEQKLLALNTITLLVQSYLLYTYVANCVKLRSEVIYVASLMAIALAIQGAVMIGLRVVGHNLSLGPVSATMDDGRVAGTIGSPVTGGSFLALMIAPTVALFVAPIKSSLKVVALAALALGGFGLLLTYTRGAWIAVGMSVSLLVMLLWWRGWVSARLPVAMAVAALLVGAIFHESISNRVFGDDEGSARGRIPLYQMAWAMVSDHPILGVGVNNCAASAGPYAARAEFRGEWFWTFHNRYLVEWVETGIIGLSAFLLFLLTTIRTGWQAWLRRDRLLSPIALALVLAMVGQMVHMFVDVFISRPQVQSLWLCAALVAAIGRIDTEEA
jgi:O-antigen ligase